MGHELGIRVAEQYRRVGDTDPQAQARLMARLRREAGRRRPGIVAWERREAMGSWSLAPMVAGTLLLIGGLLGWVVRDRWMQAPGDPAAPQGMADVSTTREVRLVQFVLAAPKASQVTVVGDFNAWDPQATPLSRQDGGPWVASIPVSPGRHVYAFIVDGDRWVPDPAAPLAPEDGFGIRNSVIVVGGQESI